MSVITNTETEFQMLTDAYQRLCEAKQKLRTDLDGLGLSELEAAHLTNRFACGKFPDGRERLLIHLPDAALRLDEIDALNLEVQAHLASQQLKTRWGHEAHSAAYAGKGTSQ